MAECTVVDDTGDFRIESDRFLVDEFSFDRFA
jgi:hypothetical protein